MSVRVRFAPSPTGLLHVGALRTVLYDWLFAKRHGGVNILRIEDTDRTRYNPESEQEFIDTLAWVGIDFQEGPHMGGPHAPYRQSERKEAGIYQKWIEELLARGGAYKAYETPKELEEMREYQQINKLPIGYFGGQWRDASPERAAEAEAEGRPFVIRQRIPRDTTIVLDDAIRGRLEWDSNTVDDPVLIKADGMPTYHFAAMVDDHLMEISHVFRGEEWISSAPKHASLLDALGWERPIFVHCPVIVGADGKKLSKRHGATRVLDYAAQGYMPHPLKNFIALIGWSPGGDREVLTEQELVESFGVEGLQPSPGRFEMEKLRWLNGAAIRAMSAAELLAALRELAAFPHAQWYHLEMEGDADDASPESRAKRWSQLLTLVAAAGENEAYVLQCLELERERVVTLVDFGEACEFFLIENPPLDPKAADKWLSVDHLGALKEFIRASLGAVPGSMPDAVAYWDERLRQFQANAGLEKLGPVVHPTRVMLTGKTFGPGLFELMAVLGPERISRRLDSV